MVEFKILICFFACPLIGNLLAAKKNCFLKRSEQYKSDVEELKYDCYLPLRFVLSMERFCSKFLASGGRDKTECGKRAQDRMEKYCTESGITSTLYSVFFNECIVMTKNWITGIKLEKGKLIFDRKKQEDEASRLRQMLKNNMYPPVI